MADRFLLDAGFLVALSNAADRAHVRCRDVWKQVDARAEYLTTEGALVEALYLLRRVRGGPAAALGIVLGVRATVVPADGARYVRSIELMERYRSVRMDFVDALLVAVAEEAGVLDVLTLDRRGFETYRVGRRSFRILP